MTRTRLQPALFFGALVAAWLSFVLFGYLWHRLVIERIGSFPVLGGVLPILPLAESPLYGWPFAAAGCLYGLRARGPLLAALGWTLALGVSGALLRGTVSHVVSGWGEQTLSVYLGYYLRFVFPLLYALLGLLFGRAFALQWRVTSAHPSVGA